jgi:tRNA 2-thiouridine synthesizing protein A
MSKIAPPPDTSETDRISVDQSLDVTGLKCPLPVLKARKALTGMAPGTVLEVLVTDPAATLDFRHFSKQSGHELLLSEAEGEVLRFLLRRAA